jgi:hypothetical protein
MADVAETIEASGRRIGHHAWVEMRLFETLGRWSGTVADPRAKALLAGQSHHHAWHAELWYALLPALPHLPAADLVAASEATSELVAALAELDEAPAGASDATRSPADATPSPADATPSPADATPSSAGAAAPSAPRDTPSPAGEAPTSADADEADADEADADEADDVARLTAIYRDALPRVAAAYRDHLGLTTPVTDGPTIRALGLVLADLDADTRAGLELIAALEGSD